MLSYQHGFHAGNRADVLKHATLVAVLRHMNLKDKGYRVIDTHAGAGAYALGGRHAQMNREYDSGIARLWNLQGLPGLVQDYVDEVRRFNGEGALRQYPGSPALALQLMREQDQLRLFELHATDHGLLAGRMRGDARVEVKPADGFTVLKSQLPPPTRRGLLLIDPSYEVKTDYVRVLAALREALTRFAECTVMIWLPQRVPCQGLILTTSRPRPSFASSSTAMPWITPSPSLLSGASIRNLQIVQRNPSW